MLHPSKQIQASFHADLYRLVPENHILRKIHEVVDFSFFYDLVKDSYCLYYGRTANEPELLFRMLFIQYLYGLSDERTVQECQVNLAYKWFLGVNPEDALPDDSQLSRFRKHRLGANRVEEVLKSIVQQCVEKKLLKSNVLILDATHTPTHASYIKDADAVQCPAGHLSIRKAKQGKKGAGTNQRHVFYFVLFVTGASTQERKRKHTPYGSYPITMPSRWNTLKVKTLS